MIVSLFVFGLSGSFAFIEFYLVLIVCFVDYLYLLFAFDYLFLFVCLTLIGSFVCFIRLLFLVDSSITCLNCKILFCCSLLKFLCKKKKV